MIGVHLTRTKRAPIQPGLVRRSGRIFNGHDNASLHDLNRSPFTIGVNEGGSGYHSWRLCELRLHSRLCRLIYFTRLHGTGSIRASFRHQTRKRGYSRIVLECDQDPKIQHPTVDATCGSNGILPAFISKTSQSWIPITYLLLPIKHYYH